ncbi:hypothetical protein KEM55_004460 [Ascosphaera atra]|nr:hypothetical protein KEM55_004460 [Ascosphaera atra]
MAALPSEEAKKPPDLDEARRLQDALSQKDVNFAQVNGALTALRSACQGSFQDIHDLAHGRVAAHLWQTHLKINASFRKAFARLREVEMQERKPVDRRKLEAHYLKFLKGSQHFYRSQIMHIRSSHEGVHELDFLASSKEFQHDRTSSVGPKRQLDKKIRQDILVACHATLIHLGDLSRYREVELVLTPRLRKWDKAISYYNLARTILPDDGMAHNQLAIIGLAEGNHLEATYRLYRAICSKNEYPPAPENLNIEFKKVLTAWVKGEPLSVVNHVKSSVISLFIYLHAKCAKGAEFAGREELENEILSQMQLDLKENTFERSLLQRCALINIAAEHWAHTRANGTGSAEEKDIARRANLFFKQLNVRFFFNLVTLLLSDLTRATSSSESQRITPVMRCILPVLRNYSSWLHSTSQTLLSVAPDTSLNVHVKEFWKNYAEALDLLASTFDVVNVGEAVTYLLEEDEEALGFRPLISGAAAERFQNDDGQPKARPYEVKEKQTEDVEMLFRIKEIVRDGLALVVAEKAPIVLVDKSNGASFVYKEEGLPQIPVVRPSNIPPSTAQPAQAPNVSLKPQSTKLPNLDGVDNASQPASLSYSLAMDRMVDNLVDSETAEVERQFQQARITGTQAQYPTQPVRSNVAMGRQPSQAAVAPNVQEGVSYSPPPLPSILNTPFAPQPGEELQSAGALPGVHAPSAQGGMPPPGLFMPSGRVEPAMLPTSNTSALPLTNAPMQTPFQPSNGINSMGTPQGQQYMPQMPPFAGQLDQYKLAASGQYMPLMTPQQNFGYGSGNTFYSNGLQQMSPQSSRAVHPPPGLIPPGFPMENSRNVQGLPSRGSGFGAVGSGRRQNG